MAPKSFASYTGTKSSQNLGLPALIKCAICRKNRNQSAFSNNQITKFRTKKVQPRCTACAGGNIVELTCANCGQTEGLDSFSKQQRSNPDGARCIDCVQESLDVEPVLKDAIVEDENESESFYSSSTYGLSATNSTTGSQCYQPRSNETLTNVSDTSSRDGISDVDSDDGGLWRPKHKLNGDPSMSQDNMTDQGVSARTRTSWDVLMAASREYGPQRTRPSNKTTSKEPWAKLKAVGMSAEERRRREAANEQRYRTINARNAPDDEEDDGEPFEL